MEAYRTYITITDPQQVVLKNVPFQPGQLVEVLLLTRNVDEATTIQDMKSLFKETQSLPQIQTLNDVDITAEVEAYRSAQ
jgi:hypothetical protein